MGQFNKKSEEPEQVFDLQSSYLTWNIKHYFTCRMSVNEVSYRHKNGEQWQNINCGISKPAA